MISPHFRRCFALLLCAALIPPAPVYALRVPQSPSVRAGLEERLLLLSEHEKRVRDSILGTITGREDWRVEFENYRPDDDGSWPMRNDVMPPQHLVRRVEPDSGLVEWWIHLHLVDTDPGRYNADEKLLSYPLKNGLLFRLVLDGEGTITGIDSPYGEVFPLKGELPFVSLEPLLDKTQRATLLKKAWAAVQAKKSELEASIKRNYALFTLGESPGPEGRKALRIVWVPRALRPVFAGAEEVPAAQVDELLASSFAFLQNHPDAELLQIKPDGTLLLKLPVRSKKQPAQKFEAPAFLKALNPASPSVKVTLIIERPRAFKNGNGHADLKALIQRFPAVFRAAQQLRQENLVGKDLLWKMKGGSTAGFYLYGSTANVSVRPPDRTLREENFLLLADSDIDAAAGAEEWPAPVREGTHPFQVMTHHRTYLNRDLGQETWLKQQILPDLIRRNSSTRSMTFAFLGTSTGEEQARFWYWIVEWFREQKLPLFGPDGWTVRFLVVDQNPVLLEAARERFSGDAENPFVYAVPSREPEREEAIQAWANEVVSVIRQHGPSILGSMEWIPQNMADPELVRRIAREADAVVSNTGSYYVRSIIEKPDAAMEMWKGLQSGPKFPWVMTSDHRAVLAVAPHRKIRTLSSGHDRLEGSRASVVHYLIIPPGAQPAAGAEETAAAEAQTILSQLVNPALYKQGARRQRIETAHRILEWRKKHFDRKTTVVVKTILSNGRTREFPVLWLDFSGMGWNFPAVLQPAGIPEGLEPIVDSEMATQWKEGQEDFARFLETQDPVIAESYKSGVSRAFDAAEKRLITTGLQFYVSGDKLSQLVSIWEVLREAGYFLSMSVLPSNELLLYFRQKKGPLFVGKQQPKSLSVWVDGKLFAEASAGAEEGEITGRIRKTINWQWNQYKKSSVPGQVSAYLKVDLDSNSLLQALVRDGDKWRLHVHINTQMDIFRPGLVVELDRRPDGSIAGAGRILIEPDYGFWYHEDHRPVMLFVPLDERAVAPDILGILQPLIRDYIAENASALKEQIDGLQAGIHVEGKNNLKPLDILVRADAPGEELYQLFNPQLDEMTESGWVPSALTVIKKEIPFRWNSAAAGVEEGPITQAVRRAIISKWKELLPLSLSQGRIKIQPDADNWELQSLVRDGKRWWLHLHAGWVGWRPGLMVELLRDQGVISGIGEILIEPAVGDGAPLMFLLLDEKIFTREDREALRALITEFVMQRSAKMDSNIADLLGGKDKEDLFEVLDVLGRSKTPGEPLYQLLDPRWLRNGRATRSWTEKETWRDKEVVFAAARIPAAGAEEVSVRSLEEEDIRFVIAIESLKRMNGIQPWDGNRIQHHLKTGHPRGEAVVFENEDGGILAHLFFHNHKTWGEGVNLVAWPEARLPGVARQWVAALKKYAWLRKFSRFTIDVPKEDLYLLENDGFTVAEVLPRHFAGFPMGPGKTAYRMEYLETEPARPSGPVPENLEAPAGSFTGTFGTAVPVLQPLLDRGEIAVIEAFGMEQKIADPPRDTVIELGAELKRMVPDGRELKNYPFLFRRSGKLLRILPADLPPAAGAEEGSVMQHLYKLVHEEWQGRGGGFLKSRPHLTKENFTLQFDNWASQALVRDGKRWQIHFHGRAEPLQKFEQGGRPGFVAEILFEQGRFKGVGKILVGAGLVFVPMDDRVFPAHLVQELHDLANEFLAENAYLFTETVNQLTQDPSLEGNGTFSQLDVLARSDTPGEEVYDLFDPRRSDFDEQGRTTRYLFGGRVKRVFVRDPVVPVVNPATGAEEKLLKELMEATRGPVSQAALDGKGIALFIDLVLIPGISAEDLQKTEQFLRRLNGYPLIRLVPLPGNQVDRLNLAAEYETFQRIELKLMPVEPQADNNVVYVTPDGREGISRQALPLFLTAAVAEWRRQQRGDPFVPVLIVLPAAPYLNAGGLEEGDFARQILFDLFA